MWGFPKPIFKPHEYWLSRTRCCNSTYRLRYWNCYIAYSYTLELFRCNSTYRLRYWNRRTYKVFTITICWLQQHLPFTVLKRCSWFGTQWAIFLVATALTVYGIETPSSSLNISDDSVATALTVYGIETEARKNAPAKKVELQQHLPFTVLKRFSLEETNLPLLLQQHLPFTVLKRPEFLAQTQLFCSCNSTYRLRYWNFIRWSTMFRKQRKLQQYLPFTVLKLAHLTSTTKLISLQLQQYLPFTVLKLLWLPI